MRRSPSASAAVGRNVYAWPTVAPVAGEPEIVGARLVCATVTANAGRLVVAVPSLTLITMPVAVPTFAAAGVPVSVPSVLLIDTHARVALDAEGEAVAIGIRSGRPEHVRLADGGAGRG